jgi:hypothetical protein
VTRKRSGDVLLTMKTLNRDQYLLLVWDSRMHGLRATIACLVAALALSGCMGRTAPVAVAPTVPARGGERRF